MAVFQFLLFTTLKNTDLHALSAYEALTEILGQTDITRIRRFQKWEIAIEADSQETAQKNLDFVLKNSFILVNVNKEAAFLDKIPDFNASESMLVQVASQLPQNHDATIERIRLKTGVSVYSLKKYLIWEISSPSVKNGTQHLWDHAVVTTSRQQGILVNPLYETAEII